MPGLKALVAASVFVGILAQANSDTKPVITSPKDMMLLDRVRAAAAEGSAALDEMLGDMDVNRLFNDGAIYIGRIQQ